jgi:hypothetical protein
VDLDQATQRKTMAATLAETAERLRALTTGLDVDRLRAMQKFGVTDDHITTPAEARGYRDWNPTTDQIEPREPWDPT